MATLFESLSPKKWNFEAKLGLEKVKTHLDLQVSTIVLNIKLGKYTM